MGLAGRSGAAGFCASGACWGAGAAAAAVAARAAASAASARLACATQCRARLTQHDLFPQHQYNTSAASQGPAASVPTRMCNITALSNSLQLPCTPSAAAPQRGALSKHAGPHRTILEQAGTLQRISPQTPHTDAGPTSSARCRRASSAAAAAAAARASASAACASAAAARARAAASPRSAAAAAVALSRRASSSARACAASASCAGIR